MKYFILADVYHNRTMLFIVHVDYVIVFAVYRDQTMLLVTRIDYVIASVF